MTRFAKGVANLRSSQIRDLMSLATRPGIISFAGGMPGNDLFPLQELDTIYNNLTEKEKQVAMQYGPTCGLPSLLESLAAFLEKKGLKVGDNRLMITTGSLQAINILAHAFVDEGDDIIVENPSFIGAISAFKSYQANIISVPLKSDGIDIEALRQQLDSMPRKPKFLYITPSFHNPAGIVYSKENRKALINILEEEMRKKVSADWVKIFDQNEIPYSLVNDMQQICDDPHIAHREMLVEIDQPGMGKLKIVG
ncbi:MAG: aminotransferase class I/II-fold pyridoxal phosphate-dependent enzyme, partial [Bacteroidota bacterium]|nr:aminotransferase class I/II-fold pyridoxal phosphate-dependent enzyme [Bacteroidota bacterium]